MISCSVCIVKWGGKIQISILWYIIFHFNTKEYIHICTCMHICTCLYLHWLFMTDFQETVIRGFLWGAELRVKESGEETYFTLHTLLFGFILKIFNFVKFNNIFPFKKQHSHTIANWKYRKILCNLLTWGKTFWSLFRNILLKRFYTYACTLYSVFLSNVFTHMHSISLNVLLQYFLINVLLLIGC